MKSEADAATGTDKRAMGQDRLAQATGGDRLWRCPDLTPGRSGQ